MKNQIKKIMLFGALASVFGCTSPEKKSEVVESLPVAAAVPEESLSAAPATVNVDSIATESDKERQRIEAKVKDLKKVTIDTKKLREQIKQKWSKIDFYFEGDNLVRIRSYPHTGITERSEEFYLKNNDLMIAIIQDKGEEKPDKAEGKEGKIYYFDNSIVIKEKNNSNEKEYSIKNSDGERLLEELIEYKEIVKNN